MARVTMARTSPWPLLVAGAALLWLGGRRRASGTIDTASVPPVLSPESREDLSGALPLGRVYADALARGESPLLRTAAAAWPGARALLEDAPRHGGLPLLRTWPGPHTRADEWAMANGVGLPLSRRTWPDGAPFELARYGLEWLAPRSLLVVAKPRQRPMTVDEVRLLASEHKEPVPFVAYTSPWLAVPVRAWLKAHKRPRDPSLMLLTTVPDTGGGYVTVDEALVLVDRPVLVPFLYQRGNPPSVFLATGDQSSPLRPTQTYVRFWRGRDPSYVPRRSQVRDEGVPPPNAWHLLGWEENL